MRGNNMPHNLNSAQAAGFSQLGATCKTPPPARAVEATHDALERASSLAVRVQILVGRITGNPTSDGCSSAKDTPSGVLPSLHRKANETMDEIGNAMRAIDELENEL